MRDEFDRKLAGMGRFFDVIVLHVRENPHIARILSEWIAGKLACFRTFEIFLAWVLRRNANRVEIERVVIRLREPKNRFMTTGKSF